MNTNMSDIRLWQVKTRSVLFWNFTQRCVVIHCRSFVTTSLFPLKGSVFLNCLKLEDWTYRLLRNVGKKTVLRFIKSQKSAYLN